MPAEDEVPLGGSGLTTSVGCGHRSVLSGGKLRGGLGRCHCGESDCSQPSQGAWVGGQVGSGRDTLHGQDACWRPVSAVRCREEGRQWAQRLPVLVPRARPSPGAGHPTGERPQQVEWFASLVGKSIRHRNSPSSPPGGSAGELWAPGTWEGAPQIKWDRSMECLVMSRAVTFAVSPRTQAERGRPGAEVAPIPEPCWWSGAECPLGFPESGWVPLPGRGCPRGVPPSPHRGLHRPEGKGHPYRALSWLWGGRPCLGRQDRADCPCLSPHRPPPPRAPGPPLPPASPRFWQW